MPNKFTYRSEEKELLDKQDIPPQLLFQNLKELDILNRTIKGHTISLKGIKQCLTDHHKTYDIVDLGCGSGDVLKVIAHWARQNKYSVNLTGVDRNADAISYLQLHCADYPEITGVTSDYMDYIEGHEGIDLVHCSLFCHHLKDDELMRLFISFNRHVKTGFILNDLHRSRIAYHIVWLFTRLMNGSVLAKNDGPVSILRGFRSAELINLLKNANIHRSE